jgi:hypothetical protein
MHFEKSILATNNEGASLVDSLELYYLSFILFREYGEQESALACLNWT